MTKVTLGLLNYWRMANTRFGIITGGDTAGEHCIEYNFAKFSPLLGF